MIRTTDKQSSFMDTDYICDRLVPKDWSTVYGINAKQRDYSRLDRNQSYIFRCSATAVKTLIS